MITSVGLSVLQTQQRIDFSLNYIPPMYFIKVYWHREPSTEFQSVYNYLQALDQRLCLDREEVIDKVMQTLYFLQLGLGIPPKESLKAYILPESDRETKCAISTDASNPSLCSIAFYQVKFNGFSPLVTLYNACEEVDKTMSHFLEQNTVGKCHTGEPSTTGKSVALNHLNPDTPCPTNE